MGIFNHDHVTHIIEQLKGGDIADCKLLLGQAGDQPHAQILVTMAHPWSPADEARIRERIKSETRLPDTFRMAFELQRGAQ
jgi:hypothetical protein